MGSRKDSVLTACESADVARKKATYWEQRAQELERRALEGLAQMQRNTKEALGGNH